MSAGSPPPLGPIAQHVCQAYRDQIRDHGEHGASVRSVPVLALGTAVWAALIEELCPSAADPEGVLRLYPQDADLPFILTVTHDIAMDPAVIRLA